MDEQVLKLLQSMNAWINQIKEEVWELRSSQVELNERIETMESNTSESQDMFIEPLQEYTVYEVMYSADRSSPWPNSTMNIMWNSKWRYTSREEAVAVWKQLQSEWFQVSIPSMIELS